MTLRHLLFTIAVALLLWIVLGGMVAFPVFPPLRYRVGGNQQTERTVRPAANTATGIGPNEPLHKRFAHRRWTSGDH